MTLERVNASHAGKFRIAEQTYNNEVSLGRAGSKALIAHQEPE